MASVQKQMGIHNIVYIEKEYMLKYKKIQKLKYTVLKSKYIFFIKQNYKNR